MHRSEWKASFATLTQDRKLGEEEGVDLLETQRSNITKIKTTMLWWHSKTWLYALTYTKTRSSHTNAFNAKLYDFFLKWILEGLSIGLVSSRSWKIEIALISQTSSLNWKLTQMSSTFPQVFNLKLRKYVVHTLLINRYASSPHPVVVSRKIDWQIEIKKFVKSVKKTRSDSQLFFRLCFAEWHFCQPTLTFLYRKSRGLILAHSGLHNLLLCEMVLMPNIHSKHDAS